MLINTAARATKGYSHLSGPVKLSNCTVWSPVVPHSDKVKVEAQSPSWLYTDEPSLSPLQASQQNKTRIWECHAHGDVGLGARFLYTPPALPDSEATELVSATAIHDAITTATKEESTRYIDNYALSANHLKQQLARRDDSSHDTKLKLLKAETRVKHLAFEDLKSHEERTCDCEDDECDWWCKYKRRYQVERRKEEQQNAAGMAFEDLMRCPLPQKSAHSKHASAGMKGNGAVKEEPDDDSDELDISFEETMRLRVPMKSAEMPLHRPEYRNASQWS